MALKCKFLKKLICKLSQRNCNLTKILNKNPINSRLLIKTFSDCYKKNPTRGFWISALTEIGEKLHNGNGYDYKEMIVSPLEPKDVTKIESYLKDCSEPCQEVIPSLWNNFLRLFKII